MGRHKLTIQSACKHTHFTWEERLVLQYHFNGTNRYQKITSPTLLGKLLSKHEQTIRRELKRGMVEHLDTYLAIVFQYNAEYAHNDALAKYTAKGPTVKLGTDWELAQAISELITQKKYSPYAVIQHFITYGWPSATRISEKTLYNYIEMGDIPNVTEKDLLYAGKRRKTRKGYRKHSRAAQAARSIDKRPSEVNDRLVAGHWEMDTVYGGSECAPDCLLTLTERKTRTEIVHKIPDRTALSVKQVIDSMEQEMGTTAFQKLFLSITPDNGSEFSDPVALETSSIGEGRRTILFYAHPYCSCERGTNENHNGIIRRFMPKGSDFSLQPESKVREIQNWMNSYPRKILEGQSPLKALLKELGTDFPIPKFLEVAI